MLPSNKSNKVPCYQGPYFVSNLKLMKGLTFFLFIIVEVSGILSLISFKDFIMLKGIIKNDIKPASSLIEELRMIKTFHYIFFISLFLLIFFINLTYFT